MSTLLTHYTTLMEIQCVFQRANLSLGPGSMGTWVRELETRYVGV